MSGSASIPVNRPPAAACSHTRSGAEASAYQDVRHSAAPRDAAARPRGRIGFVLFLLVNAVLFIRPAEVLPSLAALPIYEVLILCCLAATASAIVPQLMPASLAVRPVTLCVVGLLVAIILSHASHLNLYMAREAALVFIKVVLYYLMLVAVVNTPHRFRVFLGVTAFFILCTAALALLNHFGFIQLEALNAMAMKEGFDEESGERVVTVRLQASGIFNDPNDFSLILTVGILIATHFILRAKRFLPRAGLVTMLGVLMLAMALTRSRGGFLAMIAGIGVMLVAHFGVRRAIRIGLVGLPLVVVAFGGRQTNINFDGSDTGHGRVTVWRDAIGMFKGAPFFGAGYGMMSEELHIVAHNSFVHSFAELGFFGGVIFLAAFYLPVTFLRQIAPSGGQSRRRQPVAACAATPQAGDSLCKELQAWRACVLAIVVSFGIGLCSLSRCYTIVTYIILGTAASYMNLCLQHGVSASALRLGFVLKRVAVVSVGFLVSLYVFVRIVV